MTGRTAILFFVCVSCGPRTVDEVVGHVPPESAVVHVTTVDGLEVGSSKQLDCITDLPPFGSWARNQGWGSGPNPAIAIRAAADDAKQRLVTDRSVGLTQAEVAELRGAIDMTWSKPKYHCRGGMCNACAVAIVPADRLGQRLRDAAEELSDELQTCVDTFCGELGDQARLRIRVIAPVWADGRSATRLGPALALHLRGALGRADRLSEKDLVVAGRSDDADVTLKGQVSPQAERCALALRYRLRGEDGWRPLELVSFNPKALGVKDCRLPDTTYISDGKMGLTQGERIGTNGLRFEEVHAPIVDGRLCEGSAFQPRVRLNQPAWVRIYSITADGQAMLGWQSDEALTSWSPTDAAILIRMDEDQEYRMVFVAIPEDQGVDGFGDGLPNQTHCLTSIGTGLDLRRLPPEGAAHALTFAVVEPGQGDCPLDPAAAETVHGIRRVLDQLPACR